MKPYKIDETGEKILGILNKLHGWIDGFNRDKEGSVQ